MGAMRALMWGGSWRKMLMAMRARDPGRINASTVDKRSYPAEPGVALEGTCASLCTLINTGRCGF